MKRITLVAIFLLASLCSQAQDGALYYQGELSVDYAQFPFGDFSGEFHAEGELDTTLTLPDFSEGTGGILTAADSTGGQTLVNVAATRNISNEDTTYHAFGMMYTAADGLQEGTVPAGSAYFFFLWHLDSLAIPLEMPDSLNIEDILGALTAEHKLLGSLTSLSVDHLSDDRLELSFGGTAIDMDNPLFLVNFSSGSWVLDGFPMTGVEEANPEVLDFQLHNYPNPFNPRTTVQFTLPTAGLVRLDLYDLTGRKLNQLVNTTLPAGLHRQMLDLESYAAGVYLIRLEAAGQSESRKLMLLK